MQKRTRTIITPAANGGKPCPVLEETQACNTQPCPCATPVIGEVTQPTCGKPTGFIEIKNLPETDYTINLTGGDKDEQLTGNSSSYFIYNLPPAATYTLRIVTSTGCETVNKVDINQVPSCVITWYRDKDGDGYGGTTTKQSATQPAGFVSVGGDCRDGNPAVNPGATEICDGLDNDCDGLVDEDLPLFTWYRDVDGDGYGRTSPTVLSCRKPSGYADNALDCNDNDRSIHPNAPELEDGKDNNCDGQVDEGLACRKTWYFDRDGDGFGRSSETRLSCIQPAKYVDNADDCNDNDADVYPGAPELCDGKDNNCNKIKDEGCGLITSAEGTKSNNGTKPLAKVPEPELQVSLWPNPARTEVTVSLDAFDPNKKVEIVMLTVEGRAVQAQSVIPQTKGQQVRFNVRTLGAGFYLVKVQQGVLTETKRVVIVR
jgi:hypothetical protein